jgi:sialate O-acetylesterase
MTLPTGLAIADITLPKFFSDHMVLQQECLFPIWGTAEPNQALVIRFNGKETKAVAAGDGNFSVSINTPTAGGPYSLEVEDQNQTNKVVLTDVMVGDVWLCAGQTNMGLSVSEALNAETEIAQSKKHTGLRLFSLAATAATQRADDVTTLLPWAICSPESVKDFSAVAYFFGRELGKSLDKTPIGLIDASVDGSTCEAWCSEESLKTDTSLAPLLSHWQENEDPEAPNRPGSLFNGIISPLTVYPVKGIIWYQGETNVGRGKQYGNLLKCLIGDWRQHFSSPELPFYFVQIAPFRYSNFSSEALPELWDAQLRTLKSVQGTAMVPTMDVGVADQMYPKNKQVIGQRLAKLALARTYMKAEAEAPVTGPIYEAIAYREGKIRVTFREVGSGLKVIGDSPLGSFTVCGPDEVFHPAVATIIGPASIELSSDQVQAPKAVRYCWDDSAEPSVANSADLPAFPFRTDSHELKSEETAF